MADRRGSAFLLFFMTLYQVYHSTHCTPHFVIPEGVVVVNEKETRQIPLNKLPIKCSDTDGDQTRVYWKSTNPTTLCGTCFQVWPIAGTDEYNLVFVPTMGTLRFTTQPSYLVVLGCSDDIDPEVTSIIDVRINPNTPPHFTKPASNYVSPPSMPALNKGIGDLIYDNDATDGDGDAIFYSMSESPATGLFDIGYANGKITAKKPLNLMCGPSVDYNFYVTAVDSYNSSVGPVTIHPTFTQTNRPPQVPSDVTIQIPESVAADTIVYDVRGTTDADGVSPNLYFTMKATPEHGLEYYYLDQSLSKKTIKTRKAIDYEYLDLRTVTLTIDVTDGYCKGPSQNVTIQITDVNEIPVVTDYNEATVYEGFINVDPQWNLIDPDENEKHTWSVVTGSVRLDVDTDTGQIFSVGEMDIDPNRQQQIFTMDLRVVDKNNARTTKPEPTVKVIVLDKNDNTPKFTAQKYEFGASPCKPVGDILGTVRATDLDSEFQGNNLLVFGGHSRNMSVAATGDVILTQPCEPVGAVDSLLATVTDQGLYPGPLAGIPVVVTLTCYPCPSPPPTPDTGGGTFTTTGTMGSGP